jgi:hypothetical protein
MKEIDFLPEWYTSGRKRRVGYRAQYVALGGALLLMVVWNFLTVRSISKAQSDLDHLTERRAQVGETTSRLMEVKNELAELRKKAREVEKTDSRIHVASILGELSSLTDNRTVLKRVEFLGERFAETRPGQSAGSLVRAANKAAAAKEAPLGELRFKVVVAGVAADAGDVARLICSLEDSPYFRQIVPSYSRTETLKAEGTGDENLQVSAFEIGCYLANYAEAQTERALGQSKVAKR